MGATSLLNVGGEGGVGELGDWPKEKAAARRTRASKNRAFIASGLRENANPCEYKQEGAPQQGGRVTEKQAGGRAKNEPEWNGAT
jgi:hypothetical protein